MTTSVKGPPPSKSIERIGDSRNYLSRCYTLFTYITKHIGMQELIKKQINFVNSPMGDKPCTAIPGIGPDHGRELMQHGYVMATHILSLFLQPDVNKDKDKFRRKLLNICTINARNFQLVYNALKGWTDHNHNNVF
ncbi:Barrier-to-autointegration factor A [Bulinus truncatus]|nr:Barrier-to-autointegration factor A [Bulinus truncatus]